MYKSNNKNSNTKTDIMRSHKKAKKETIKK